MSTNLELPPAVQPEAMEQAERNVEAAIAQLGAISSRSEVVVEPLTEEDIKQGIEELEAYANDASVREEDAGRVHDIEAAYKAAKTENEIFDVYEQAQKEHAMFEAHAEALKENEMVKAYEEAVEENKKFDIRFSELTAEEKQKQEQATEEAAQQKQTEDAQAVKDARTQAEARKASSVDYKVQAEAALKQAGYDAEIPTGSQVTKDAKTGDILIAHDNDVRVLSPQPDGSAPKVVDYHFDAESQIITIRDQGDVVMARVGNYVQSQAAEGQTPEEDAIDLPPAVKKLVGFERAIPLSVVE